MAKREALRELQARIAQRMQVASTSDSPQSWLAVECAGHGLLFPLAQAGEIFSVPPLMPVPHTQHWFIGVANLRGGLHGVIDLAAFLGVRGDAEIPREQARLIAINPALEVNGALLVDRLAGLRSPTQLEAAAVGEQRAAPAFVGASWRDSDGRSWQELDLSTLSHDEHFLRIGG